jgi:hypothetical protein
MDNFQNKGDNHAFSAHQLGFVSEKKYFNDCHDLLLLFCMFGCANATLIIDTIRTT